MSVAKPGRQRPILRKTPIVPVYLPAMIVQMLEELGMDGDAALAGTGLLRQQIERHESLISLDQMQGIFENFWHLGQDPFLGIAFGKRLRMSHLGTFGAALLAAPSLRTLLDTFARFHLLMGPAWTVSWREVGYEFEILARRTIPLGNTARLHSDSWFIALARGLTTILEGAQVSGRLEFDYGQHDASEHRQKYLQAAAPFDVRFDCVEPRIVAPSSLLDHRLMGGSAVAFDEAVSHCEQMLSRRLQLEDLPSMVMRLMQQSTPQPSLAMLAERCNMSERTLERRLSEFGLIYRQMADDALRNRALALIRDTTVSIDDIAEQLGYSDVSAFGKAFKRWADQSPAAYRAEMPR